MINYELLGTHKNKGRILIARATVAELRSEAIGLELDHWAIYKAFVSGRPFHNATDEAYLVEHFNDPYWLNRGVDSTQRSVRL